MAAVGLVAGAVSVGATGGGGPVASGVLGSGSDTTQTMMAYLDYGYTYDAGYGFNTPGGCQQLATSPTPQWLDFSCADSTHGDIDRTVTDGVTTAGSNIITSATANFDCEGGAGCPGANRDQGRGVTGGSLPSNCYIDKVDSSTQVELGQSPGPTACNAAASASGVTLNINRIVTDDYTHDQVHGAFFLGSSNGIAQLCGQGTAGVANIDYARSSRAIKSTGEACHDLKFVAYARDAISWEAWTNAGDGAQGMNNTSAPCAGGICLTQAQLKGIYVSCTITNWNQVGGNNVPISIYTEQPGSGTRSTFEGFLGGSSTSCIPAPLLASHQIPENSNVGIPVSDEAGAIFPFSWGVWTTTVNGAGGTVLGQIDGVTASKATIQSGSFPWGRFLYNVYCSPTGIAGDCPVAATPATVNYVGEHGWICKNLAEHAYATTGANFRFVIQSKIAAAGFVPVANGVIGGGDPTSDYCRMTIS
ncbi:MAG: substrate-binding domain-containing protein [Candidatus Dormibacteraeota bacterium]|nr:substrate-binding domain-containing protein [Candidatus Dormibacteraeota bacterium]